MNIFLETFKQKCLHKNLKTYHIFGLTRMNQLVVFVLPLPSPDGTLVHRRVIIYFYTFNDKGS